MPRARAWSSARPFEIVTGFLEWQTASVLHPSFPLFSFARISPARFRSSGSGDFWAVS